jgi:2-keto-4-pentenoate hydratase/2-oxohepta-3-ene-1,7-dioic acid hydratase in catechol pathway
VTARDIQEQAKKKALPWAVAKGFDSFAVLGKFASPLSSQGANSEALSLELRVNGELRQVGRTADMLFSVPALIAYLSKVFTLHPGDLIYTGTPAGVAPLQAGDEVEAQLNGADGVILSSLTVPVRGAQNP